MPTFPDMNMLIQALSGQPVEQENVELVGYKPGPNTKFTVLNKNTGVTTYHDTLKGAIRAQNNQDNKYGGYITTRKPYGQTLIPIVDPRE